MLDMGFADDLERILGSLREIRQTALFSATIAGPDRAPRRAAPPPPGARPGPGRGGRGGRAGPGPPGRVRRAARRQARPRSAGSSTSRTAPRRSCSPGPAARSTTSRRRCRAAAATPPRSTAACPRSSATGSWPASATAPSTCSSRPTSPPAASTSSTSATSSTTTSRRRPDTYVHRIGRTGRAGREGVAITLVEPREHRLLRDIERTIGQPLAGRGPADRRPTSASTGSTVLAATLREALVRPARRTATGAWSRRCPASTTRSTSRSRR